MGKIIGGGRNKKVKDRDVEDIIHNLSEFSQLLNWKRKERVRYTYYFNNERIISTSHITFLVHFPTVHTKENVW